MPTRILSTVQPGDLITAADWNLIVETLDDAMNRIVRLEASTPTTPPDKSITLALQPQMSGGALTGTTLTIPAGEIRTLGLTASFTVAGLYRVTRTVSHGNGWTAEPFASPETIEVTAAELARSESVNQVLRYKVAAAGSASAAAELEIVVQRDGEAALQSAAVNLVRG